MSSGFVTETEVLEARKKRQEEWTKVRQPDQPLEVPEEPYDSRSLFERLKEQKDKRDLEYDEAHKMKNMIRGLDDDEIDFLDFVDRTKMNAEKKQLLEEHKEMAEFRERAAALHEKSLDDKVQHEIATSKPKPTVVNTAKRLSQKSILAGVVVKKRKTSENNTDENKKTPEPTPIISTDTKPELSENETNIVTTPINVAVTNPSAFEVIGILPGIGGYKSDSSSDSEDECAKYDWVGRKVIKRKDTSEC